MEAPEAVRGGAGGFALLELLVVISIIALLIAILLPVLQHARQTAQQVACLSNFRQIGILNAVYENDYPGMHIFFNREAHLQTDEEFAENLRRYKAPVPLARESKNSLLYCPADREMYGITHSQKASSYLHYWGDTDPGAGLSQKIGADPWSPIPIERVLHNLTTSNSAATNPKKLSIQRHEVTAVIDDEPSDHFGTRHTGVVNALALDGHAETVSRERNEQVVKFVQWLFDD